MSVVKMRANRSVVPPAENGTTTVTARLGQACSWATDGAATASSPAATSTDTLFIMAFPLRRFPTDRGIPTQQASTLPCPSVARRDRYERRDNCHHLRASDACECARRPSILGAVEHRSSG